MNHIRRVIIRPHSHRENTEYRLHLRNLSFRLMENKCEKHERSRAAACRTLADDGTALRAPIYGKAERRAGAKCGRERRAKRGTGREGTHPRCEMTSSRFRGAMKRRLKNAEK